MASYTKHTWTSQEAITAEKLNAIETGLSNALTTADASSTYLTQSSASSTYLTKTNASSTYLTISNASSTYLSKTDATNNYLTKTTASSTYLTISDASSTYLTQSNAGTTYLSKTDAASTYLSQVYANTYYLKRNNGQADEVSYTSSGGGVIRCNRFGRIVQIHFISSGSFSYTNGVLDKTIDSNNVQFRPQYETQMYVWIPTGGSGSTSYTSGKLTFSTDGKITIRNVDDSVMNQPQVQSMKPDTFIYLGQVEST